GGQTALSTDGICWSPEFLGLWTEWSVPPSRRIHANGERTTRMSLPLGFKYATTYAGIRKVEKDDLALIVSERPATAAAVFTQNIVVAAPVVLARQHLAASNGIARAILINAGNANCATRTGDRVALTTCKALAGALNIPVAQVLPAS